MYCTFPYWSTVPNRCKRPSSNKRTTSNSHQIPDKTSDKTSKIVKKLWNSSDIPVRLAAAHAQSPLPCKQSSTWFLFTIYLYCRYQTTGFIIEINRLALKPFHSRTVLLLGHIRYCSYPGQRLAKLTRAQAIINWLANLGVLSLQPRGIHPLANTNLLVFGYHQFALKVHKFQSLLAVAGQPAPVLSLCWVAI